MVWYEAPDRIKKYNDVDLKCEIKSTKFYHQKSAKNNLSKQSNSFISIA